MTFRAVRGRFAPSVWGRRDRCGGRGGFGELASARGGFVVAMVSSLVADGGREREGTGGFSRTGCAGRWAGRAGASRGRVWPMHCPRCTFPIEAVVCQGVEVDHCRRCLGSFFDAGEAPGPLGEGAQFESWRELWGARQGEASSLRCPKDGEVMVAPAIAMGGGRRWGSMC